MTTPRYFSPRFRLMLCDRHLRYGVDGWNQMVRMTAMHEYSDARVRHFATLKTEPFNIEFARACAGLGQNFSTSRAAAELAALSVPEHSFVSFLASLCGRMLNGYQHFPARPSSTEEREAAVHV